MPFFRWGRRADPADPAGPPAPPAPPAPAAAASAGALSSEPTFEESILSAGFDHPTFFDTSHWSATLETWPSVSFSDVCDPSSLCMFLAGVKSDHSPTDSATTICSSWTSGNCHWWFCRASVRVTKMQSEISGDIMIKLQWVQGNSWNVYECAFHISITYNYSILYVFPICLTWNSIFFRCRVTISWNTRGEVSWICIPRLHKGATNRESMDSKQCNLEAWKPRALWYYGLEGCWRQQHSIV